MVPKVEQEEAPPEAGSMVVFDEQGNLVAGQEILEEIVTSGKPKLVLIEHGNSAEETEY